MREPRRNASPTFCSTWSAAHERSAAARAPAVLAPLSAARFPSEVLESPLRRGAGWRTRVQAGTQCGLTIIELMIVVAIVAILAMIGYPSYEDHLRKGRRAAAQGFVMEVAGRQQQYLLDARGYAVGAGALGALRMNVPGEVSKFYTVTIDPAAPTAPPSFTVIATPIPGSRQVPDGALTVDHMGARTRNGQPGW